MQRFKTNVVEAIGMRDAINVSVIISEYTWTQLVNKLQLLGMFSWFKGKTLQWMQHFGDYRTVPPGIDFKSKDFGHHQWQTSMHYFREYRLYLRETSRSMQWNHQEDVLTKIIQRGAASIHRDITHMETVFGQIPKRKDHRRFRNDYRKSLGVSFLGWRFIAIGLV